MRKASQFFAFSLQWWGLRDSLLKFLQPQMAIKIVLSSKSSSPSSIASHAPVACPGSASLLRTAGWPHTYYVILDHSLNTLSLSFLPHGAA